MSVPKRPKENANSKKTKSKATPTPNGKGRKPRFTTQLKETDVEAVLTLLPPLFFKDEEFYVYDNQNGCYFKRSENAIGHLIMDIVDSTTSVTAIKGCIQKIKWMRECTDKFHPGVRFDGTDILHNVQNGIVRISPDGAYELETHAAKWMFKNAIPVDFDPQAKCPYFNKELNEKLTDVNDRNLFLKFGAYCGIPDCRFNIMLFNYGDTHTGKSTLLVSGIGSVYGDLVSVLKLDQICSENWSGISFIPVLEDKLVNIGSEIDDKLIRESSNLKRVVSGEPITAREAYGRTKEIRPIAKMVFNMNELPKINGTQAEVQRIRLIYFSVRTQSEAVELELGKKIEQESYGIYIHFLNQYKQLLQLKEFPHGGLESKSWEQQLGNSIDIYDHFLRTYKAQFGPNFITTHNEMFRYVIEFLSNNFLVGFTYEKFMKSFKKRCGNKIQSAQRRLLGTKKFESIWVGIRLTDVNP
jgi:hypothetical protein